MTIPLGLGHTLLLAAFLPCLANLAHAEYVMTEGKGWLFCEALFKELKRQAPGRKPDYCPVQMLRSLPGVTEPQWEELDVTKHEDLLRKLVLYTKIGSHEAYFDPVRRAEALERVRSYGPLDKELDNEVENARKGLIRLQIARVNLLHADPQTGKPDPELETILRRTWLQKGEPDPHWRETLAECDRRYPSQRYENPDDFIVKDDLTDLDQKRSGSVYFSSSLWKMVLFYERKDYMVSYDPTGNGYTVMRDAHDGGYVGPICSIIHTIPKVSKGAQK